MKHVALILAITVLLSAGCQRPAEPPVVSTASLDPALAALVTESRQAVLSAAKSAEAWGKLGQALHAAEFLPEARQCYRSAAGLDPRTPRWPHLLGVLELADDFESGIRHLQRAVELGGAQSAASRLRLGQALLERGRIDEALVQLNFLVTQDAQSQAAMLALARALVAGNQSDKAASILQGIPTRDATMLLAQIRQRQGDKAESARLVRLAPTLQDTPEAADPFLNQVLSLRADARSLADQANALLVQRKSADAEAVINRLLQNYPGNPEGLLLLGRLRYQQQRCAEAEEILRRHLAAEPQSLNGLLQLALAQFCQQRWGEAVSALKQAIALKPDSAPAHYNLGYALLRTGDSEGGIAALREAVRCDPGDVRSRLALADALRRTGDVAGARVQLDRVLEANPGQTTARQMLERLEK
jgi:tetratricopeptide (TPR) repeat protein